MYASPRPGGVGVRVAPFRRRTFPAVAFTLAFLTLSAGELQAQDPVSGWWNARVQDAGTAPEVVFMLRIENGRVLGRRVRAGQDPIPVSGAHRADSVHLHFSVPEGSRHLPVDISAVVSGDRLTGVWRVTLPGGREVERRWVAVRTRGGEREATQ